MNRVDIDEKLEFCFSYNNYNYFYVPIVGPLIGGPIGAWIYMIFVGLHNDNDRQAQHMATEVFVTNTNRATMAENYECQKFDGATFNSIQSMS